MKYLAITAILCFVLAGALFAGNVTMTEVITGGTLTLTMPNAFSLGGVTLGGVASTYSSPNNANYLIEDSRGSGVGWNLGFAISQFTASGTPSRLMPTSAFTMQLPQVNIDLNYGQTIDNDNGPKSLIPNPGTNINGTETKAVTSAIGYGMGKYTFSPTHLLTIDASTYAGTYTATLTATLNNAP